MIKIAGDWDNEEQEDKSLPESYEILSETILQPWKENIPMFGKHTETCAFQFVPKMEGRRKRREGRRKRRDGRDKGMKGGRNGGRRELKEGWKERGQKEGRKEERKGRAEKAKEGRNERKREGRERTEGWRTLWGVVACAVPVCLRI